MTCLLDTFQMAEDELTFPVTEMHTVPPTVTPIAAILAFSLTHPFTLTVGLVAVLPYLHEIVLIDIPLVVVGTDTGTSGDGAVCHHRTYRHASLTVEA